jgi:hypothetical protein
MFSFGLAPEDDIYSPDMKRRAMQQGLQGFGSAILSRGYSPVPRGPLEGVGAGVRGYQSAFQDALNQGLAIEELKRRREREAKQDTRADTQLGLSVNADKRAGSGEARAQTQFEAQQQATERTLKATQGLSAAVKRAIAEGKDPITDQEVVGYLSELKPVETIGMVQKDNKPDYMTVGEGGSVFDKKAGKFITSPGGAGGNTFRGTGMEAQAMNILLKGNPESPEYAAAYSHLASPRLDLSTGTQIKPDMSAFRPPGARGVPNGAPAASAGGRVEPIPGFAPKMTEGQATSALYADRMAQSNKIVGAFEEQGLKAGQRFMERITPDALRSYALTPEYQQFEQAKRDFVNATLRRESGAVINPDEFRSAERQYFPQPGDSKEVIAQKRANRATALAGIQRAGGPGYKPPGEAEDLKTKYGLD